MTDPIEPGAAAPEFGDSESLLAWLRAHERGVSAAIAVRASLRVLPMLEADLHHVDGQGFFRSQIVLPVFRALAASWCAARYPEVADRVGAIDAADAAEAADDAADATVACDAAIAAGFAAESADLATSLGEAAKSAAGAVGSAAAIYDGEIRRAFWEAISADAEQIEAGAAVSAVAESRLWPEGQPLGGVWRSLRDHLLRANEDWQVWTGWYDDRLIGCSREKQHELSFVRIPEKLWNRGPLTVNGWIRQELARLDGAKN